MVANDIIKLIAIPELKGTDKQIAWGKKIQQEILIKYVEFMENDINDIDVLPEMALALEIFLNTHTKCCDLIDFYQTNKYCHASEIFKAYVGKSVSRTEGDLDKWDKIVMELSQK